MEQQGRDSRGRRGGDLTPERTPTAWAFVRIYLNANAIEFFLGLAAVIGGLAFLAMPEARDASSIGGSVTLAWCWTITYTAAGLFIVVGILASHRPCGWRLELAGLYMLTGGLMGNGVAVAVLRPGVGAVAAATYVCLALGAWLRARALVALVGAHR